MPLPRQADILRRVLDTFSDDVHTCLPGRVEAYDVDTQLASIRLGSDRLRRGADGDEDDDAPEPYPILLSVPVVWPGAGQWGMHCPMGQGDSVAVFFPEASIDRWLDSGEPGDPGLATRHGLDGAFAVPGLRFRGNRWTGNLPDPGAMMLGSDQSQSIRIGASTINVGGGNSLGLASGIAAHLQAIATALTTIAAAASSASSYVYATVDAASPVATTVTKGS